MPTLEHNGIVEMFRDNPDLVPHLLAKLFHAEVPAHATVEVAESALDQLLPVELRADLVLDLRDEAGNTALAVILEVQRGRDPDKRFSWLVYAALARAKKRCPAIVLVVTPDAEVAAWAAEKIDIGLGLGTFQPLVLGPSVLPEVTDPAEAEREVELTILSAMAHGNGPNGRAVLDAAITALWKLDREHAVVYFEIIHNLLREPMQRALEALVMERNVEGERPLLPFFQRFVDMGKLEGKLEGIREGHLDEKREILIRLMGRASIAFSDQDRARILACTDGATLDRWIDNALGAQTVADVLT